MVKCLFSSQRVLFGFYLSKFLDTDSLNRHGWHILLSNFIFSFLDKWVIVNVFIRKYEQNSIVLPI